MAHPLPEIVRYSLKQLAKGCAAFLRINHLSPALVVAQPGARLCSNAAWPGDTVTTSAPDLICARCSEPLDGSNNRMARTSVVGYAVRPQTYTLNSIRQYARLKAAIERAAASVLANGTDAVSGWPCLITSTVPVDSP